MDKAQLVEAFISNFIAKHKRERVQYELSHPKKRAKFIDNLNHRWEDFFDMRKLYPIDKKYIDSYEHVKEMLRLKDDEPCYVLSNYGSADDKILPFINAYHECYGEGLASLIIDSTATRVFLTTELVGGHKPQFIGFA